MNEFSATPREKSPPLAEAMVPLSPLTPDDVERWLDRLVDGELSLAQQRQLLHRLDDLPGAWRRCALAFLESRAWQRAMPALAAEAASPPAPQKPAPKSTLARRGMTWLAMAASFLLAFSTGLALKNSWQSDDPAPKPPAKVVGAPSPSNSNPPQHLAGAAPNGSGRNPAGIGHKEPSWSTMRVKLGGGAQDLELPVVDGPDARQWVENSPQGLPPEIVAQLERSGYQVQTRRRLMPVDLEDGRRVIVPVDEVQVVNASMTSP